MKKATILLLLLYAFVNPAFCQTTGEDGVLPNLIPPSPEAAALGKYVEHPVSTFTGTPSIEIPLFEIKTGRITVPISLSYHGSGVKVDEIASRTGIGWVLTGQQPMVRMALQNNIPIKRGIWCLNAFIIPPVRPYQLTTFMMNKTI